MYIVEFVCNTIGFVDSYSSMFSVKILKDRASEQWRNCTKIVLKPNNQHQTDNAYVMTVVILDTTGMDKLGWKLSSGISVRAFNISSNMIADKETV